VAIAIKAVVIIIKYFILSSVSRPITPGEIARMVNKHHKWHIIHLHILHVYVTQMKFPALALLGGSD
jgi:hypothetical protein